MDDKNESTMKNIYPNNLVFEITSLEETRPVRAPIGIWRILPPLGIRRMIAILKKFRSSLTREGFIRVVLAFLPFDAILPLIVLETFIRRRSSVGNVFLRYYGKKLGDHARRRCLTGRLFPVVYAKLLMEAGWYQPATKALANVEPDELPPDLIDAGARSLFELKRFAEAEAVLDGYRVEWFTETLWERKAHLNLVNGGDPEFSKRVLSNIAARSQMRLRPHQNLSSRDPADYEATEVDYIAGGDGRLFDTCNYLGQRVTHVGAGDQGPRLYAMALGAQKRLNTAFPPITPALSGQLKTWGVDLDRMRIAPPEWAAQIGHLGMLDILCRMRTLGWWDGDLISMGRAGRIANRPCLELFRRFGAVAVELENVTSGTFRELISLQRYRGLAFNAWEHADGRVVPWQEAGAEAMIEWEARGLGHPLRDAYDHELENNPHIARHFERARAAWGMEPNDWFVCLHMRDAGYYREAAGTGQTHRNAKFGTYLDAVNFVTQNGGWIVRLGDPNVEPLPKMARVVDYARSPFKSAVMDLHLIRNTKYFIGTTSGLTNMAVSFGVPCALVNCITTDAQLWHSGVRFALKPIVDGEKRILSQRALTTAPHRWNLFSVDSMKREGLLARANNPDEILETVKEVHNIADGVVIEEDATLRAWRASLGLPHFYGMARPSRHYLGKYGRDFWG